MRMPADWEIHNRCWIGLPAAPELWQQRYPAARQTVLDIANKVIDFEPVNLLCPPGHGSFLRSYTDSRIEIIETYLSENWLRDIAPTYLETPSGKVKALFPKNVRYLPSYKDMKHLLADQTHIPSTHIPVAFDNGDLTTDGEGTALCTISGMFGSGKNHSLDEDTVEKHLSKRMGLDQLIWIKTGLRTDHTQGQIVNLVRFVRPGVVLLATHGNNKDPNKAVGIDTFDQLSSHTTRDVNRRKVSVYQVFNPPPIYYKNKLLTTSYTNYYVANNAVIIPKFYKPKYDNRAVEIFRELFPKYQIIQQPVLPLLTGGGGIHCVTCPQIMGAKETLKLHKKIQTGDIKPTEQKQA